jgi:tRNA-guanine family transglycosylase
MHQILNWIIPLLPDEKPRHLLGIGHVRDIFECVELGIDLFDCVVPTREARHKVLYTREGKFPMRKLKTRDEPLFFDYQKFGLSEPVTFVDLYDLFLEKNPLAYTYATLHNIEFFGTMMQEIRDAIRDGKYEEVKKEYLKYY